MPSIWDKYEDPTKPTASKPSGSSSPKKTGGSSGASKSIWDTYEAPEIPKKKSYEEPLFKPEAPQKESVYNKVVDIGQWVSNKSPVIKSLGDTWYDAFHADKIPDGQGGFVAKETFKGAGKGIIQLGKGIFDSLVRDVPKAMVTVAKATYENLRADPNDPLAQIMYGKNLAEQEKARDEAFNQMLDVFDEADRHSQEKFKDEAFADPENFGYKVGRGGGSMLLALGVTVATKDPAIGAGLLGTMQGTTTYQSAQAKLTKDREEKLGRPLNEEEKANVNKRALASGIVDGTLNSLIEEKGIEFMFTSNTVSVKALGEVIQEVSQQIVSNIVEKGGFNKDKNIWDDLAETAFVTLPIGFLGGLETNTIFKDALQENLDIGDEEAGIITKEVADQVREIKQGIQKNAEMISNGDGTPSQRARGMLDSGMSPSEVALALSTELGADRAKSVVKIAQSETTIDHSEPFDVDKSIEEGSIKAEDVYSDQEKKTLTPEFAKGRVDDIAQKLDILKKGVGDKFRAKVEDNMTLKELEDLGNTFAEALDTNILSKHEDIPKVANDDEDEKKAKELLDGGMSPTQVALHLSDKLGAKEARAVVEKAQNSIETKETPTVATQESEPTTLENRYAIEGDLFEKTPTEIQKSFEDNETAFQDETKALQSEIDALIEKQKSALAGSKEKKEVKVSLEEKRQELRDLRSEHSGKMAEMALTLRDKIEQVAREKNKDLTDEQVSEITENALEFLVDPRFSETFQDTSASEIIDNVFNDFIEANPTTRPPKEAKPIITPIEDQENTARELAEKQRKSKKFGNPKKVELKVGDVIDTQGKTNMKDPVKIREIKGNTIKLTDADGTEYSGMASSMIKKLIAEGSWKMGELDKTESKEDNDSNERPDNNSGSGTDKGDISDSLGLGTKGQRGSGTKNKRGTSTRGKSVQRDSDVGARPQGAGNEIGGVSIESGKKYSNKEIESIADGLASINESGIVELTDANLITPEVLEALNQYKVGGTTKEGRGILDEYFTDSKIVDIVSQILNIQEAVKVLEPSVGSGNFIYAIPENLRTDIFTNEINSTTAKIAKAFHNNIEVSTKPFESIFMDEKGKVKDFTADYDLVLGNPPYGDHRGLYKGLGEEPSINRYETYFIKRGLDLLKPKGRLAMVVPSGFLRGGVMGKKGIGGNLVEAWRLPNGSFSSTDIGTDIVIFEKGEGEPLAISNDSYFKENPDHILGVQEMVKGKFGLEPKVKGTIDEAINMFNDRRNASQATKLLEQNNIEVTDESLAEATETVENETGKVDEEVNVEKIKKDNAEAKKKEKVIKKIKTGTTEKDNKGREIVPLSKQAEAHWSAEELDIWARTNQEGYVQDPSEAEKKTLNYLNGQYYNDFNYAQGDIYEKLRTLEFEKKKANYDKQKKLLESVLPKPETVASIKLPPNHEFVETLKMSAENEDTLARRFTDWVDDLPHDVFGESSSYEVREYVRNRQVRGSDKLINEAVRNRRKVKAEELFYKYLNQLSDDEKEIIEDEYNKTYNSYYKPDFKTVPLQQSTFSTFDKLPFELRDSQKEALGMIAVRGSAIVALDVGNGKTIVGVLSATEAIHRGFAKRPLIVVPNESIAQQWIDTAKDLVPNVKINNFGNLGSGFNVNLKGFGIKDGEISVVTKEGLMNLEFSDSTYSQFGAKFGYVSDDLDAHKTKRQQAQADAKDQETEGRMKKGSRGDLSFEDLGFDHLTFDEVHLANHIVSKVKMDKDKATDFRASQMPSSLGIKTWLASHYIQEKTNGKNVVLLSATPFTNHPLEYYSVISLVADKYLEKIRAQNVNNFFNMFMEASSDYEVKANGKIDRKNDIRGFKNARQWRNLLKQFMVIANQPKDIIVPDKENRSYYIPQSELQMQYNLQAQELFKEKEAGALQAVGEMRKIAFSPFISRYYEGVIGKGDYKMFVEGSPKILSTMELIKQNLKDKPEAGQIIYLGQTGVDTAPILKEYLVKELGLKEAEVGIITGAVPQVKRTQMQNDYNAGKIKVIIGSDSIQVGMNLQINSTDLYLVGMPWNFTSLRQISGRIWRQNNKWKNVRINVMMSENSADVFQMQKIQNKQDRYEASIQQDSQDVDLGDIDSEEMKSDLITDPKAKAEFIITQRIDKINNEINTAKAELAFSTRKFDKLNKVQKQITELRKDLKEEQNNKDKEDDYWLNRYTEDLEKALKEEAKIKAEYEAKGIDVQRLAEIQTRTTGEIEKLEAEKKEVEDGKDALIEKITKEMPRLKVFNRGDVNTFVAERAEQNKTFFAKREAPVARDIKVLTKNIMNESKTKVLKTKKTIQVSETVKQKPLKTNIKAKNDPIMAILLDSKLNTVEKVSKLLDKKQENKAFKDTGERVAGSKKENAVIKAVLQHGDTDILDQLIDELGIEAVQNIYDKETILENTPKPDVEKDQKNKVPAYVGGAKQTILRLINNKPSLEGTKRGSSYWSSSRDSSYEYHGNGKDGSYSSGGSDNAKGAIKLYPDAMKYFVEKLEKAKTAEEISDLGTEQIIMTPNGKVLKEAPAKAPYYVFFKTFFGKTIKSAIDDVRKARNRVLSVQNGIETLRDVTKDNIVEELNGYAIADPETALRSGSGTEWVYSSDDKNKDIMDSLKNKEATIKALEDYLKKEYTEDYSKFLPKKIDRKKDVNMEHGNFAPIDVYDVDEKAVPDTRVKTDTLTKELGFKSVQLGNYVDDESAKEHIRQTIGALEDMSKMLNVDFASFNNKKGLSIAFGARGGGKALAHYEPTMNIINLTKKRGDGSFGHEYGHFIDWTFHSRDKLSATYRRNSRSYYRDTQEARELMQAILTGRGIEVEKTFKPEDKFEVDDYTVKRILARKKEGATLESMQREFKIYLQDVANVYRKEFTAKVPMDTRQFDYTSEFYANSKKYGGDGYWVRNHELFARAFQAYLEDKMEASGIKNEYVTRPTKDISVYPQGIEREYFNKKFDEVFAKIAQEFPYKENTEPRFKLEEKQKEVVLTKGGDYLADVKARLKIDFDVHLFDSILYNGQSALGAMADNTILLSSFDQMTKAHETMHLVLANADRLPIFQRAGITRQAVLQAQATEMGKQFTKQTAGEVEEQLADNFEKYLENKYKARGIIQRFFEFLRTQFAKFKRAIGLTNGEIIQDFYDILDEGVAKEEELTFLENQGIVGALINDTGTTFALSGLPNLDLTNVKQVAVKSPMFKFTDKTLQKYSDELGQIESQNNTLEQKLGQEKEKLQAEIARILELKSVLDGSDTQVKDISKYTYRTSSDKHQLGQLTKKGLELANEIQDPELQARVSDYIKNKIELKDARTKARQLRQDMKAVRTEKKLTSKTSREFRRKLRRRKIQSKYMAKGFDISGRTVVPRTMREATKYGKKSKAYEIKNRQSNIINKMKVLPLSTRGKISLLVAVRRATTDASYASVMKKINQKIADYNQAKIISKDLASDRSKIGFLKHIGDMDEHLIRDVKAQLGLEKPMKSMTKEELRQMIDELKERLTFKAKRGAFAESAPLTEAQYNAIAKKQAEKTRMERIKEHFKDSTILSEIDRAVGSTSTRLYGIAPELSRKARDWYVDLQRNITTDERMSLEFLHAFDKLRKGNKTDFAKLDLALKNRDMATAQPLLTKHGINIDNTKQMLEGIYSRARETNVELGYLQDYFPRKVKSGMEQDLITVKIKKAELQLGRELTDEERIKIANNVLLGFDASKLILTRTGNMKERLVDVIDEELAPFYEDSIESLKNYISTMNGNIEARKFFGKFAENADMNGDLTDTVGAYVMDLISKNKITWKDQKVVTDMLKAMFSRKNMGSTLRGLTNISYIATMFNATSAITQLQDFAFSLAENGFWGTGKGLVKAIAGRGLTLEELYLDDSMTNELGKGGKLSEVVKWVFKGTGIKFTDSIALKTFVNGRFDAYKSMAKKEKLSKKFIRELKDAFGDDYQQAVADLKRGELTEEVKRLIIDDALDVRPQGATEKPEYYNSSANGKAFYTLKQYTLKQIDVFRKLSYLKIRNGIKTGDTSLTVEGFKNLIYMGSFLILMGIGADELKDWVLGRDKSLSDRIIDNIIKLFGINKYIVDTATTSLADAVKLTIEPIQFSAPWDMLQSGWTDMMKALSGELTLENSKALKYTPLVGNILKNRVGSGAVFNKKDELNAMQDKILKASLESNYDEDEYIDTLQEERARKGEAEITPQAVGQLKREYRIVQEYGSGDRYVKRLEGAKDNNAKVGILQDINNALGENFEDWLENANDVGLVSDQLYDQYIEETE